MQNRCAMNVLLLKNAQPRERSCGSLIDVVGKVKELDSREYQEKVVFALIDRDNLFPFNGYPLFGSQKE